MSQGKTCTLPKVSFRFLSDKLNQSAKHFSLAAPFSSTRRYTARQLVENVRNLIGTPARRRERHTSLFNRTMEKTWPHMWIPLEPSSTTKLQLDWFHVHANTLSTASQLHITRTRRTFTWILVWWLHSANLSHRLPLSWKCLSFDTNVKRHGELPLSGDHVAV